MRHGLLHKYSTIRHIRVKLLYNFFMAVPMTDNMIELLLEAHRKGIEQAIDLSIRIGVPLVIAKDGIIQEIKPKYKYIRVPITTDESKISQIIDQCQEPHY